MTPDFKEMIEEAKEQVEKQKSEWDNPDDDLFAFMLVRKPRSHDDHTTHGYVAFDPHFFSDEEGRARWLEAIIGILEELKATSCVLVTSTWLRSGEGKDEEIVLEELPILSEQLLLQGFTVEGESYIAHAPIKRFLEEGLIPEVGDWDEEEFSDLNGPVQEALKHGLAKAAELNEMGDWIQTRETW